MNILITVGIFPPDIGGPATFVPKISDFLAKNGHDVKIICLSEDENINLEDSVKSFEKGINLVKECQKELQSAELKIKKLLDDGSTSELNNT